MDRQSRISLGARVYGFSIMAFGVIGLSSGDFVPGQAVPKEFFARTVLAYVAAALMLLSGGAIQWRRTVSWGAAALAIYYTLFVVVLMNGRVVLHHYAEYVAYSSLAEQLAIAAGALILYANAAKIDNVVAARLKLSARIAFGICALLFGGAHFIYMNMTAPLVPKWLPPSQETWGYITGVAFIVAGVALISGLRARLAAFLLTAMLAGFGLLVHLPILLKEPASRANWSEAAINFAIMGVAWIVADSLGDSGTQSQSVAGDTPAAAETT